MSSPTTAQSTGNLTDPASLEGELRAEKHLNEILIKLVSQINAGKQLDEVLNRLFDDLYGVIPFERIGCALLDPDGESVTAHWARSNAPTLMLGKEYSGKLTGSSLQTILATGKPRILNDLEQYLIEHPYSDSTRLIVAEGYRASLTCPLIANGQPVGFLFFSSPEKSAYKPEHIKLYQQIANPIAVIVEKARYVTELSEQAASIQRQNAELKHLHSLKNTFMGIAAHDLRNPVSFIQLASRILYEDSESSRNEDEQRILQDIIRNAEFILALLNDLLDISQFEAGAFTLYPRNIPLANFLQSAIDQHAMIARQKNITVLLEAIPGGDVFADPNRLQQVIDNLLSNAIKFSTPGTQVIVRALPQGSGWRVEVQDQGPGISSEDRQNIFKEFQRLNNRPTGGEKTTGLGLAIAHRVIEAHGGELGVDSEMQVGSTFWFALPGGRKT